MGKVRLAIPTDDGVTVAPHFGRAKYFVLVELEEGKEVSRTLVENLHARGHGHHDEHHLGRGNHGLHGYHGGWRNGNGNGNGYGHHHGNGFGHGLGHGHGHDEVFASIGNVDGVIAVRVGPHMFEDLKSRKVGVYLVRVGTSVNDAIAQFSAGTLRDVTVRKV